VASTRRLPRVAPHPVQRNSGTRKELPGTPPDIIEGEEEWEVEQILDRRIFGRSKKLQFLVRWKGYSPAHDQWVNKEDMAADDLVRIFERENPHDVPVQRPARSKKIRATTVDFDSPDIASSGKPLWNPRTRTSWQLGLGPRKHLGAILGPEGAHTN